MSRIRLLCGMATLTTVLLANLATWASPVLKEYLEIDYDSAGTPMQITRRWQLDDNAAAKVRVLRNGAVYVMTAERHKRVGKFWFSLRADEVYVVEMPEDQVKMALKTPFATLAPEPEWKPLGEKQVAGVKCRGWSIPSPEEPSVSAEIWVDAAGSVVYSASFSEGRLVSQSLRVRSGEPSQSDRNLFTIPSGAKQKRVSLQVVSSLLLEFFGTQQGVNPSPPAKR